MSQLNFEEIVNIALECNASDIHFKVDIAPVFRVDGHICSVEGLPVLNETELHNLLMSFLNEKQKRDFEANNELDAAVLFPGKCRVRINLYKEILSIGCAMRIVPLEIPSIEALGLPHILRSLTETANGLILVTGVTGAGKSTTLAAMIDAINERDAVHIYTMEDPVEYVHRSKRAIITQREIGSTTTSFSTALRSALRADPDVLLIGEMRDAETMRWAMKAAETGHLVFSTLHTSSAPKTIQRILGAFDPHEREAVRMQFAYCLKAVICQQLVPLIEGGRMPVHEILVNTLTVQDAIFRGDLDDMVEYMRNGNFDGMQTMDMALYEAYRSGQITADTAKAYSLNPGEMERILRGATAA